MEHEPRPADPEDEGVPEEDPPAMQVEPARLLANEARDRLRADGFNDRQIDEWAETYVTEFGSGDVEQFIGWIAAEQGDR